jgi:cell filamentation protein
MPSRAVQKGDVIFCHPQDCQRAVSEGLRLGQITEVMRQRPGEVMGLFGYGHPFLDGNGRTMLLVHLELSYRADFSIAWADTNKDDYLAALSKEIETPGKGILDNYLLQFVAAPRDRKKWADTVLAIRGLDGLDEGNRVAGDLTDPRVAEIYRKFEERRGYSYAEGVVCRVCGAIPCICGDGGGQLTNGSGSAQPKRSKR